MGRSMAPSRRHPTHHVDAADPAVPHSRGGRVVGFSTFWGLAAPLAYAGATYAFFDALERRASPDERAAISEWIKSVRVDRDQVAAAVQELFDRVYGYPFLSWRTAGRVAAFSIVLQ